MPRQKTKFWIGICYRCGKKHKKRGKGHHGAKLCPECHKKAMNSRKLKGVKKKYIPLLLLLKKGQHKKDLNHFGIL